jgi:hypothetical protein
VLAEFSLSLPASANAFPHALQKTSSAFTSEKLKTFDQNVAKKFREEVFQP